MLTFFPSPAGMSLTKFSLDGKTSPLGPGKPITFFTVYSTVEQRTCFGFCINTLGFWFKGPKRFMLTFFVIMLILCCWHRLMCTSKAASLIKEPLSVTHRRWIQKRIQNAGVYFESICINRTLLNLMYPTFRKEKVCFERKMRYIYCICSCVLCKQIKADRLMIGRKYRLGEY